MLIEGDNLHALTVLNYTHAGEVDVVYIDPPYNTDNKDFKYNDRFVDWEDSYLHSKWLSFMYKRLQLACTLLKPEGVIFYPSTIMNMWLQASNLSQYLAFSIVSSGFIW